MAQQDRAQSRPVAGSEMTVKIFSYGVDINDDAQRTLMNKVRPHQLIDCTVLPKITYPSKGIHDLPTEEQHFYLLMNQLDGRCRSVRKAIRERAGDQFAAFLNIKLRLITEEVSQFYSCGRRLYTLGVGSWFGRHRAVMVADLLAERLPKYCKFPVSCTVEHLHLTLRKSIPEEELLPEI